MCDTEEKLQKRRFGVICSRGTGADWWKNEKFDSPKSQIKHFYSLIVGIRPVRYHWSAIELNGIFFAMITE